MFTHTTGVMFFFSDNRWCGFTWRTLVPMVPHEQVQYVAYENMSITNNKREKKMAVIFCSQQSQIISVMRYSRHSRVQKRNVWSVSIHRRLICTSLQEDQLRPVSVTSLQTCCCAHCDVRLRVFYSWFVIQGIWDQKYLNCHHFLTCRHPATKT